MNIDLIAAEESFRTQMRNAGLVPPDGLMGDGKLHRVDAEGKPGKKDGWYVLHLDGIPSGAHGDWHEGQDAWNTWCFVDRGGLSQEEYAEHKRRLDEARAARSQAEKERRQEAQARANRIWDAATPCESHPYLERKGVKSFGLREAGGRLVIPLQDRDGQIHSVEFIDGAGMKLFLSGGRKAGCWYAIGEANGVLCVAEGYATAASIHEATGQFVAVAFDCGNMPSVAKQLRDLHPTAKIVICADDDKKTKGNPGATAAAKAAQESNAMIAVPALPNGGDFNDQHALKGLQSVADVIVGVLAADRGPVDAGDLFPWVMQEIIDRKEGKKKCSVSFGIKSVDKLTRKIQRGGVTFIGGLPGSGKTSAALGIVGHNASHGIPCFLSSLEMDRYAVGVRMLSHNSMVTAIDIFDEDIKLDCPDLRWSDIVSANGRLEKILLTVDDRSHSIASLTDAFHKWHAEKVSAKGYEFGLAVIDFLGLIGSDTSEENRNLEVTVICKALQRLARTLGDAIVITSQLSRKLNHRGGEPELSDLRDSGTIEQVADLAIFPWPWPRETVKDEETGKLVTRKKQAKPDEDDRDVWIVRKNRNGPIGAAPVLWHHETMQYTGLEPREYDGPNTQVSGGNWQDGRDP